MAVSTLEEAVEERLLGFGALTALVSTKIYPMDFPQDCVRPAVAFTRDSTENISAFGSDTGNVRVNMEVSAWADTYESALAICKQVKAALQRWSGTYGSVIIQDTFVENEMQSYESDTNGVQVSQSFIMWYR